MDNVWYDYFTSLLAANSLKLYHILLYDLHSLILIQAIDRTFLFVDGSQLFTPSNLVAKHRHVVMEFDLGNHGDVSRHIQYCLTKTDITLNSVRQHNCFITQSNYMGYMFQLLISHLQANSACLHQW